MEGKRRSKRLVFTVIVVFTNFVVFTVGLIYGADPMGVGSGLAMMNAPLYAWVLGESFRPSKTIKEK